ncbi:MAG: hypothetical protein EKK59_02660 [Neisseriaceae bacterium]|nr:MAG: hypothetical protein EKK59_02660 [Neisseriaceae bacterium]
MSTEHHSRVHHMVGTRSPRSWDWIVEQTYLAVWTECIRVAREQGHTFCSLELGGEHDEEALEFEKAAARFFVQKGIPHYPMLVHESDFKRRVMCVATHTFHA